MILGIIGGIGSGKSMAVEYLSGKKGYISVKTDLVAFEIMEQTGPVKDELIRCFGPGIFKENGKLEKSIYGKLLYGSVENRKRNDTIVHPAVWNRVKKITEGCRTGNSAKNAVVETALPSENLCALCDEIWYIQSGEETRIRRLMETRSYTRERAVSVLKNQPDDETYLKYSDRALSNDGTPEELFRQIELNLKEL